MLPYDLWGMSGHSDDKVTTCSCNKMGIPDANWSSILRDIRTNSHASSAFDSNYNGFVALKLTCERWAHLYSRGTACWYLH